MRLRVAISLGSCQSIGVASAGAAFSGARWAKAQRQTLKTNAIDRPIKPLTLLLLYEITTFSLQQYRCSMIVSAQPFAETKLISRAKSAFRQTAPALPLNNRTLDSHSIVKNAGPLQQCGCHI
jgi:hypothetical protein